MPSNKSALTTGMSTHRHTKHAYLQHQGCRGRIKDLSQGVGSLLGGFTHCWGLVSMAVQHQAHHGDQVGLSGAADVVSKGSA
jgi:hypothetical protein